MPLAPTQPTELLPASTRALAVSREAPKPPSESEDGAEAANGLTPTQVLHALRRRWLVAIPLAAAMATLVYVAAENRLTPVYTARTLIHVGPTPVILYDNLGGGGESSVNNQRTQMATVKSRLVRQAVVRDLEPLDLATLRTKPDPIGWLEKEIVADYSVAPEILRVTMKGSEPDDLLLILNAVRDSYLREIINKDRAAQTSRLNHLKELAGKQEIEVKAQRQKLTTRAEAFGVRDLPSLRLKYESTINRMNTLQTELLIARLATQGTDTPGGAKEEHGVDPRAMETALEQAVATDMLADGLRKDVGRLENKITDFADRLVNYKDDPDYKRAVTELATARASLSRRREALRGIVTDQLRAAKVQNPAVGVIPGAPAGVRPQIAILEAEIQRKERETGELVKGIAELELLRGEAATQEEQLVLMQSKIRPLEVEMQAPPRASVLEEAVIVETPAGNRTLKMAVAPAGMAFVAVVFFVAWLDLRRGRVNGSADLEAARIRVIGAVPSVGANVLPVFALPTQDSARRDYLLLTDAIDMTRTVIAPVLASAPGFTLVVTSAVAGEGKTVLSAHLAARFARSGLRTLLIDTDVRRPQIHHLFALKSAPGFGDWVSGVASLSEVVTPGPVPGLDIIPAGGCDARTVASLLELRFPELLRVAKQEYDVIVLDTAPLLCTSETLALSRFADGVVLSVMRDVSRLPSVQVCTERLASINARVLGAVVTGDTPPRYGSY